MDNRTVHLRAIRHCGNFVTSVTSIILLSVIPISFCNRIAGTDTLSYAETGPTAGCGAFQCHESSPLAEYPPTSGKHSAHINSPQLDDTNDICLNCHWDHDRDPLHRNGFINGYDARSEKPTSGRIVHFGGLMNRRTGVPVSAEFDSNSKKCNSISCHGGGGNVSWYTAESGCSVCHRTGSSIDPVSMNGYGTAGKHGIHVKELNLSCEKCHNGYKEQATHFNGTLDAGDPAITLTLFDETNESGSWFGDTGPNTGSCTSLDCHGSSILDWYSTNTWTLPSCSDCHRGEVGTRRQVFDSNGDGSGTGGDFNRESHHVIDYDNRNTQIVTDVDCQVCHNMDEHMSGTIRLNDQDSSGSVIAYDPALPASAEPFCLGCHDGNGANGDMTPFTTTSPSPNELGENWNEAGNKIKNFWNGGRTVHKDNGLTCLGTGKNGTGCHGSDGTINAHGSTSKGILAKNMTFPVSGTTFVEDNYRLCFDCHDSYPTVTKEAVMGFLFSGKYNRPGDPSPYDQTIATRFRERSINTGWPDYDAYPAYWEGTPQSYNDGLWTYSHIQLHFFHLLDIPTWIYRGQLYGQPSCITCHNVHGTPGDQVRSVYDELTLTRGEKTFSYGGSDYTDYYTEVIFPASPPDPLLQYPFYCGMNCHQNQTRHYWHSPADE